MVTRTLDGNMAQKTFEHMGCPLGFDIEEFKTAFARVAHQNSIFQHKNREGYNCHFRAVMKKVKKLIDANTQKAKKLKTSATASH